MKNLNFKIANFLLALILSASGVFAANSSNDKVVALVEQNLSAKLKTELVAENLSLKFTSIETSAVSNNEVILKGEALAVLPAERTELPLKFEAKVDTVDDVVADVQYVFVNTSYAPSSDEELLMRHLLKKVAADYKTENVVIAIDGFETENLSSETKEYKGLAEIRIGDIEWKRIDFDIVLNDQKQAQKVAYKLR